MSDDEFYCENCGDPMCTDAQCARRIALQAAYSGRHFTTWSGPEAQVQWRRHHDAQAQQRADMRLRFNYRRFVDWKARHRNTGTIARVLKQKRSFPERLSYQKSLFKKRKYGKDEE